MKMILIVASLVFQVPLFGQTNSGVSDFRKYASPAKKWCIDERQGPNLFVSKSTKIKGSVSDEIEKHIVDIDVWVTVRNPKTNQTIVSVRVGKDGSFDLGTLEAGEYDLRVSWADHGVLRRLTVSDQPRDLSCSDGVTCHLDVFIYLKWIARIAGCPQ
jgi:hypothetical protein